MNIRSFVDNQCALGRYDKLLLLVARWARRAVRWSSENCQDLSEALEVAGHGCRFRLKGHIVSAQSCEMTFEEIMFRIENLPTPPGLKYLPNKKIVKDNVLR
jgi:hypothetical protein